MCMHTIWCDTLGMCILVYGGLELTVSVADNSTALHPNTQKTKKVSLLSPVSVINLMREQTLQNLN